MLLAMPQTCVEVFGDSLLVEARRGHVVSREQVDELAHRRRPITLLLDRSSLVPEDYTESVETC